MGLSLFALVSYWNNEQGLYIWILVLFDKLSINLYDFIWFWLIPHLYVLVPPGCALILLVTHLSDSNLILYMSGTLVLSAWICFVCTCLLEYAMSALVCLYLLCLHMSAWISPVCICLSESTLVHIRNYVALLWF